MILSGEIIEFINKIDFKSKEELIQKLRDMRTNINRYEPRRRNTLKQMIGVAIQQVYRSSDVEIEHYVHFKKYTMR
jgi:hypothetical protein